MLKSLKPVRPSCLRRTVSANVKSRNMYSLVLHYWLTIFTLQFHKVLIFKLSIYVICYVSERNAIWCWNGILNSPKNKKHQSWSQLPVYATILKIFLLNRFHSFRTTAKFEISKFPNRSVEYEAAIVYVASYKTSGTSVRNVGNY